MLTALRVADSLHILKTTDFKINSNTDFMALFLEFNLVGAYMLSLPTAAVGLYLLYFERYELYFSLTTFKPALHFAKLHRPTA